MSAMMPPFVKFLKYDRLVSMVTGKQRLVFARYGDGEWHAILGRTRGKNTDGHLYFPEMGTALAAVLQSRPSYFLGLQPLAIRVLGRQILDFLDRYDLDGLEWYNADVFHWASQRRLLSQIVPALAGAVWLAPRRLLPVMETCQYRAFVDVPLHNAWLAMDRLITETQSLVEKHRADVVGRPVIVVCAGMGGKVAIDCLARTVPDATILDTGSVWDPYAGFCTRRYHSELGAALEDLTLGH